MNILPNLLTPVSYAKRKGLTKQYVYKCIKTGKIKAYFIDGVPFIDSTNSLKIKQV